MLTTTDALDWLTETLERDGRDPVVCNRLLLTRLVSELRDLRRQVETFRDTEPGKALADALTELDTCREQVWRLAEENAKLRQQLAAAQRALAELQAED